jgi:FAD/FMN-containing dehydrogenase
MYIGGKIVSIKEKLKKVVGAANFSDDPKVLDAYSKDFSVVASGMPNYVVKATKTEQVEQILKLANEFEVPVVPVSSRVHFNGSAIPRQGGIILDVSTMDKILEIDELNRRVRLEPGVSWEKLIKELDKKGYRMMMPLLPHPERSVVIDHLEREVITNTVYDYGEPMQSMEIVWPVGEAFRTGSASVNGYPDSPSRGANPSGPGLDFYRFIQGAQGTMGVVTWANLKIATRPSIDKILFAPVFDLAQAIDFLYRILPIRIGQECLLLNNTDLAAIIADNFDKDFEKLRATLPPWSLVLVISGLKHRPEEKIGYEMDKLNEILKNEYPDIVFADTLPGITALDKKFLPMLRKPWPKNVTYWKNRFKGACQSLFFIAKPVDAPLFREIVNEVAVNYNYPIDDIGCYIQPIEHNRACCIEFNFFYDPEDEADKEKIEQLYYKAAEVLLSEGAVFSRPYGKVADMVYDKAADYKVALRRVKKIFDPKNIMNPGNLCF